MVEVEFEVGRPPGFAQGSSIDHSLAINVGSGLPLAAGRYEWGLQFDDEQQEDWRAAFTVRQPQGAPAPGLGAGDSPANLGAGSTPWIAPKQDMTAAETQQGRSPRRRRPCYPWLVQFNQGLLSR